MATVTSDTSSGACGRNESNQLRKSESDIHADKLEVGVCRFKVEINLSCCGCF